MNSADEQSGENSDDAASESLSDAVVDRLLRDFGTTESVRVSAGIRDRLRKIPQELSGASETRGGEPLPESIGSYIILERMRSGGMGCVYRAYHSALDREVALKTVLPRSLDSPHGVERFQREMRSLAALDHPNVVRAYDGGTDRQTAFLVMELVQGHDLKQLSTDYRLSIAECCELIRQAACGLAAVHEQNVIHRDVKPANIMLTESGEVKLIDFGLALSIDEGSDLTGTQQVVGSGRYIAPEQRYGANAADHRCDLFSLGRTLETLLDGYLWEAGADGDIRPTDALPPPLRQLLAEMLAQNPAIRIQSAKEVAERLAPFCVLPELLTPASLANRTLAKPSQPRPDALIDIKPPMTAGPQQQDHSDFRRTPGLFRIAGKCVIALLVVACIAAVLPSMMTLHVKPESTTAVPSTAIPLTVHTEANFENNSPAGGNENHIAAALVRHGATVTVNMRTADQWQGITTSNAEEFQDRYCLVQSANLFSVTEPAECLSQVLQLQYLQGLHAQTSQLTDKYLHQLPAFPEMKWLYIPDSSISDDGVAALDKFQASLENIVIDRSRITAASIESLSGFSLLRELRVAGTRLGDRDFESLPDFPNLITLDISETAVTEAVILHLQQCSHLRRLHLRDTKISDAAIDQLASLDLSKIDLTGSRVTSEGIAQLRERHADWTIVH